MRNKLFIFLLVIFLLVGCTSKNGDPTNPPGVTTEPTETEVVDPSTSTPGLPLVILVIPPDLPRQQSDLYQATVNELARGSKMRFQVRNSLSIEEVNQEKELSIVVAFPPDPGMESLASQSSQVHYLAVNIPGLAPANNLSVIGARGLPLGQQAFLAGYIAALLSPDFRVGIITQKETPDGVLAYDAFVNGMHFYCGLCNPQFPPWYKYPVHSEIPTDVPEVQYRFYADPLKDYVVDYAYVYPGIATEDLLDYMSQVGLNIISQERPSDSLSANWVVSIKPEVIPAIQAVWPALLAGQTGQDISLPLFLVDVNPDLLSQGKQADVQGILDRLLRGEIDTGVNK